MAKKGKASSFILMAMPTSETMETLIETLDREDLTPEEWDDLNLALRARQEAYTPYSHFKVGAVIRTGDGNVAEGWNVENVIYSVLHAEENALGRLRNINRQNGLKRITVAGGPEKDERYADPVYPCGICRQKLMEFFRKEDQPMVLCAGLRGKVVRVLLEQLIPNAFCPSMLKMENQ